MSRHLVVLSPQRRGSDDLMSVSCCKTGLVSTHLEGFCNDLLDVSMSSEGLTSNQMKLTSGPQ